MLLFDTLTRTVRELEPREPGRIGMYTCGPTVQAAPHFGHARAAIVPDVLRRHLVWTGLDVFHVRNVTDVEDKIIAAGQAEGRPPAAVAEHYSRVYDDQMRRLGILPPHVAPRATGHLLEMQELIARLVETGHAYEVGGDVWFRVRSFPAYGRLSGRDVDELRAGARIEPDERKDDPADFALWKAAKAGEPSWPSPWGRGRPGWHIECSAMARAYLGDGFDVHTGGLDLQFPHHENEIAQAEAATGVPFARHWVHNGMLTIGGGEKMSKSVGNVISLAQALDRYGADVIRMLYLAKHYRSPVEFGEDRLTEARAAVERWRAFLRATRTDAGTDAEPTAEAEAVRAAFRAAMDDDLGTPAAQAALFDAVSAGNAHLEAGRTAEAAALAAVVRELAAVLGYGLVDEAGATDGLVGPLVDELLAIRAEARERKDFATSDRVRDRLAQLGVVVEDRSDGATWHLA